MQIYSYIITLYIHTCVGAHVNANTDTHMYTCAWIHVCTHIYTCAWIHVVTHIHPQNQLFLCSVFVCLIMNYCELSPNDEVLRRIDIVHMGFLFVSLKNIRLKNLQSC